MSRDAVPLTALRNIGPVVAGQLALAGVRSVRDLRALGADAAYARLLAAGTKAHFIGYVALAMALQDRLWTECRGAEKAALRLAFDSIVAHTRAMAASSMDAALMDIGVMGADASSPEADAS